MESSDGLQGIMAKYHDHDKVIWVTEYGAPTDGEANTVISETAQVQLLRSAFELASQKPNLGPIFWYNFRDWCPKGKTDPDCYYGLLRFDNSRKPSYAAFMDLH
jgi:exo-beta-1,3-glucanase (GH17 family)